MKMNLIEEETLAVLGYVFLITVLSLLLLVFGNILQNLVLPGIWFWYGINAFLGIATLLIFTKALRRDAVLREKEIMEGPLLKEEVVVDILTSPEFDLLKNNKSALIQRVITYAKEENIYFKGKTPEQSLEELLEILDRVLAK